ncbi:hypothetical protein OL229_21425 [Neisseriaceae bacterium JH1-16]|nr:hypothetical protein [Neisseriaceae bacterium JH1-16]
MKLISLYDLAAHDIRAIWAQAKAPPRALSGTVAWSFEGNGIRTRTTFIQAFRELGLDYIELPNLLKSAERPVDLTGYLDPFYAAYVVREADHQRLAEFAAASCRPVINAMSRAGHPCEVLADAAWLDAEIGPIATLRIGLWGPMTNVLTSWHELAAVLGLRLQHFGATPGAAAPPDTPLDVLITDGWPNGYADPAWTLTLAQLARFGQPWLLPTPPFTLGAELGFDPVSYPRFVGYAQKQMLLPVQRALLGYLLD